MIKSSSQKLLIKALLILLVSTSTAIAEKCSTNNYSALVVNAKSNQILFEEGADNIVYPASLTKLMTIYLTFEAIKQKELAIDQILVASDRVEASSNINKIVSLNMKAGDKILVKNAIQGVLVKSYNELAVLLAEKIAGSEWQFARKMNMKAKELGMDFTNFRNASGLDNEGQYTTSEDLAKLVLALKKDFPEYVSFFALKKFTYNKQTYKTNNEILLHYLGADGMKTGFTNRAGYNLITSVSRNGNKVVAIVTGCESLNKRLGLTKELLDNAFKSL